MVSSNQSVKLAECIGLWIAEGDDKTIREITFTNNCEVLIRQFYDVLSNLFPTGKFRLYSYTPGKRKLLNLKGCIRRCYTDTRANRPYYILRYADTKSVIKWKSMVQDIVSQERYFPDILRGFFAGEGNIKTGAHYNRTLRIAQKEPIAPIDTMLKFLGIAYKFSTRERAYVITGWNNWEKFYRHKIYILHPEKRERFLSTWESYKEVHYPANFIRNNLLQKLSRPMTSRELAIAFDRSQATLQELLCEMKSEGKLMNYRCRSLDYWVRADSNLVVISDRKSEVLKLLQKFHRVYELAQKMDIDDKSVKRRLVELERLGLVKHKGYLWNSAPTTKEVLVL